MPGQVDLQWGDGHVAIGNGMEVRALARILSGSGRADPVQALALGIGRRNDGFGAVLPPRRVALIPRSLS